MSAASSTSVDEPATLASTSVDEQPQPTNSTSMSGSLLTSIDEAYHSVSVSVHDAEVAVDTAWQASLPVQLWRMYASALETNPVRTKAITSFVGFVLGDVMAQKIGGADPAASAHPLSTRKGPYHFRACGRGCLSKGGFAKIRYLYPDRRVLSRGCPPSRSANGEALHMPPPLPSCAL